MKKENKIKTEDSADKVKKKQGRLIRNSGPARTRVVVASNHPYSTDTEVFHVGGRCFWDWRKNGFCPWFAETGFGTRPCCSLFINYDGKVQPLFRRKDEKGVKWTMRCPQCIEAEEEYNKCLRTR